jgi:ATP-dependent Clp protease ATP-binding subunit ClpB
VVVFHSLEQDQIRAIAELQIEQLKRRLRDQNIDLRVSHQALDKLTQAGFDPVYGARPLKRSIQTHLETPLARELLAGRFGAGDTVSVEVHGEELMFHTVPASS